MKKEMKKVPAVRFKGFTGDWEQRKLGEIADKVTSKNKEHRYKETLTNSAEQGIVSQKEYFDHSISNIENINGYYVVEDNDFVYNPRISTSAPVGPINRNKLGRTGIMSPLYTVFKPHEIDESYLEWFFKSSHWYKFMYLNGDTGARSDRFAIKDSVFFKMPISVPTFEEQYKVGDFLNEADHLLTLNQQKLDQLKKLKAYFLQNLFPAKGEKVPKIRFKGFTGDWEQYKLSNIYGTIRNAFVGTASPYYVDKGHFYLESNNVKDGHINKNTQVYINDEFYFSQKDKWLHTGDIVMVQSGHVGHAAVIPESLDNIAAHALIMFQNQKIETNPYFLNTEYQTDASKKQIESITKGNTIKHILASDMKNFMVMVPSLPEQQAIATYFKNLDNLIAHNQRKLDALQTLKKYLLQNLFI